jgi:hypothetical protein
VLLRHARRSVTILLAALLALTTVPVLTSAADASTFRDTAGSVYQRAVDALAAEGIIQGCTETDFCPNRPILRGQIASMIARANGLEATRSAGFRDVEGVHAANIDALAEAGITQGCSETRFCPVNATSRAEMASFIDRGFRTLTTGHRWFADTGGTHAQAIDNLGANGITAGCSRAVTDFCPTQTVLRGQVALFLARALDLVPRTDLPPLSERQAQVDAERNAVRTSSRSVWDDLARCESGGNWSINTGNGYYGGLQFSLSSWRAVGGSGYPHRATKAEQINRGERLQAKQGWGAWPACSRKLGLR